jgi:site-specific recombinase XerC
MLDNDVKKTGLPKNVTVYCFRHLFATRTLERVFDCRDMQELIELQSNKPKEICTWLSSGIFDKIKSPLDRIMVRANSENNKIVKYSNVYPKLSSDIGKLSAIATRHKSN